MHDGQDSSSNNVHVHDGIVQNLDQMMEKLSNRKEGGMRKQEIRISLLAFNFPRFVSSTHNDSSI